MNKRKVHFNAIDLLILLFVAAVITTLLYVFVFDENNSIADGVIEKEIEYVILVQNIDESLSDAVRIGQSVQESVKKQDVGQVTGVQVKPYTVTSFDYASGKEISTEIEGKISLEITVKVTVSESDRALTVGGCEIRVGQSYGLMFPNLFCTGYVIGISE